MTAAIQPNKPKTAKQVKRSILAPIAIIIALAAVLICGWTLWQQQQLSQQVVAQSNSRMASQQQLNRFNSIFSAYQNQTNLRLQKIIQHQTHTQQNATNVIDALGQTLYLCNLANLAIIVNGDTTKAVTLLNIAQKKLMALPELMSIRSNVIKIQNKLAVAGQVDVNGIMLQLNAVKQSVYALKRVPTFTPTQQATNQTTKANPNTYSANWKTAVTWLRKFFIISKHDASHEALPSLGQFQLIQDSFYLDISKAQWALLQKNNVIYKNALSQALSQLNQLKSASPSAIKYMRSTLKKFAVINIDPSYISLDPVILQIQQVRKSLSKHHSIKPKHPLATKKKTSKLPLLPVQTSTERVLS